MFGVRRRSLTAWLLAVPLMVVGTQVAHVVAYRLVYPSAHVRVGELLATGHGYMGYPAYVPVLLGLGLAAELVWLGSVIAAPGRQRRAVAPWLFALLPLLGFTLQELLERWLSGAGFPWWMVLQPTFRVGLALQIPFAIAAYLIARLAARGAERAGRALRPAATRVVAVRAAFVAVVVEVLLARRGALAGGYAGRGPPAMAPAAHP
jgi:hypothetical protein